MRTRAQAAAAAAATSKKAEASPAAPARPAAQPGNSGQSGGQSESKRPDWDPIMENGSPGFSEGAPPETPAQRARRLPPVDSLPDTTPRVDAMVDVDHAGQGVKMVFYHHDHGTSTERVYPNMEEARKRAAFVAMTYGIDNLTQLNTWLEERKIEPFPREHLDRVREAMSSKPDDIPEGAGIQVLSEEDGDAKK